MKTIVPAMLVLSLAIAACASDLPGVMEDVSTQAPTQTPFTPATAAAMATSTPVVVTPTAVSANWILPDPPSANVLPTELSSEIRYIAPPENCAKENDPNLTCSTLKGQVTVGDFVLRAGQGIVMTGDNIGIFEDGGALLADKPSLDTQHDLWVVINATDKDVSLEMLAPDGSFRGYFEPTDGKWNIQKITHLRDLHLYLFLLPTQTYDRFTPTPVPNCESSFGCEKVNNRVVVIDEAGPNVAAYGLYLEGQPFWQNLLQLLGQ